MSLEWPADLLIMDESSGRAPHRNSCHLKVLVPEWKRLGIEQIGVPGFCALKLSQRLLDPVPAGNCKLQKLRQYYRLPENGAHTALGDVLTVIDLMQQLRPLAENRGLDTWEKIVGFAGDERRSGA